MSINVPSTVNALIWLPIMDNNASFSGSEEAFVTTGTNGNTGTSGVLATAAALIAKARTGLATFLTLRSPISSKS
jgi:hypothetical protein